MGSTAIVEFESYAVSVAAACEQIGAGKLLAGQSRVLVKPNLVTGTAYPVTTPAACCAAVIDFIRAHSSAEITIAEGTGDPCYDGMAIFDKLGYTRVAAEKGVELIDLNTAPVIRLENPDCKRFPEFFMPEIAMNSSIISVPVLKAHSLAGFTGTMKNMMGFAPPARYAGGGGVWNKAEFHIGIQQAIVDLNRYRRADLTIMDAAVGLPGSHLGGRPCNPPVNKILAGVDPVATDRQAAGLLGIDWEKIGHLNAFSL